LLRTAKKEIAIEYRFKHKKGYWIWCHVINSPFEIDENGEVVSFIGSLLDITQRKKIEDELIEKENLYRNIFNNNSIMLLIDPETSMIIDANEYACNYYGYQHHQITKMRIAQINTATEEEIFEEMKKVKEKIKKHLDFNHKLANGEIRDVEVYSGPVTIKNKKLLLSVIHDVTEKKENEQKIKKYIEEIKDINEKLENYSYTISHDLKEPIRSIITFSEFIKEDNAGQFDEQTLDYFNRIVAASGRMKLMIDDLLVLSRVGKKDIEMELLSVSKLIDDVIILLDNEIKKHNVTIQISEMPKIYCQPAWLKIVFQNLISNSMKFNDKDQTKIEIYYQDSGEYHEFTIKDNSRGIDKSQQKKVFVLFRKAHQDKSIEGSGAGLAIVTSVLEQHKGNVWIHRSELGEGTEIKFTIKKDIGEKV